MIRLLSQITLEFYYIEWNGAKINSTIKEGVDSASPSAYSHKEFKSILEDKYEQYGMIHAIESPR